jgi:YD repeat-containing protein
MESSSAAASPCLILLPRRKNQQITYTYDQLNQLTGKTYSDSTIVNYTYDNDSRLTQVSDPTGTSPPVPVWGWGTPLPVSPR